MDLDRKLIEKSCKKVLFEIIIDSQHVRNTLSFSEQVKMLEWVKNFSYQESISAVFYNGEPLDEIGVRDFEGKFRKFLKYGFAGLAGGLAVFTGPLGLLAGPPIAMFATYLFRKATDPCYRMCAKKFGQPAERKACKYECQVRAAQAIVKDIKSQIPKCRSTKKPIPCEKKLNKEYIKWSKKLQVQLVNLQKAKANLGTKKPEVGG